MKLSHEDYEHLTVLTLRGDLADDHVDDFRLAVKQRMAAHIRDFVLDVSEMDFVDSKGLEVLLWLQETCGEKLGQVRVAAPKDNVKKIMEMTRLAARFDCHPDVDSAIKSLR